ncbi:MAG TPA: hypothetical protein VEK07_23680 [Polyangiaceae bacterium]|nr:hypothetical protein [Polyangiaceae bacterium]
MLGTAPSRRLACVLASAFAVVVAFPPAARAQSSSDQAAAEALFKQGRDLMAAGQYSAACPKFVESERLDPAPGTLLNLATCYEKNGQVASAWVTFKEAATAAKKADQPERARMARDKAAEIEPNLPTLTIVVPAAADRPDLQIRRDGEAVGRPEWSTPIPVDPGTHVVEASGPGMITWQVSATIAGPSSKASVEVPVLEAAPRSETPASPQPPAIPTPVAPPSAAPETTGGAAPNPHPGSTQRTVAWVFGGVGLAGLATGAILGGVALSQKNDAEGSCVESVCVPAGYNSMQHARSTATLSDVAFAVGGGLLATGLVFYVTAPHPRGPTVAVVPVWLGSAGAGGLLRASF